MKTFGIFARERIRLLGKSQKAFAKELGVSPAYISQVLTGKKNPPDLGRPKNRSHLRSWSEFLEVPEEEILDLVRFELHRVPPRPDPRFRLMRELLVRYLDSKEKRLIDEIRAMELHPAERMAIRALVQIYMVLQEEWHETSAYSATRFQDFCRRAVADKGFVERDLVGFFRDQRVSWSWDAEADNVRLYSDSGEIRLALERIRALVREVPNLRFPLTVPVVGHVSAGEGFEYTDGGFCAGEGFEQVPLPPGVDESLAQVLYCVRVRGDSLREFFGDGTLLFIKPESWEEIRDGDLVIFKDRSGNKAFVKKVEFAGENLILKPMNQYYKNMVLQKSDLMLLERVTAIVL